MLAVRAISTYTASGDNQIDVEEGQLFYVLSVTADKRKYYLSTSARVPFSRFGRSGFSPVPLFVVVGDTLSPADRANVKAMISDNAASQPTTVALKVDRLQVASAQVSTTIPRKDVASSSSAGIRSDGPASIALSKQEPQKGFSHNISAVARYWFGGIMGRPRQDGTECRSLDTAVPSINVHSISTTPFPVRSQTLPAPTARVLPLAASSGSRVTGAQIVNYARGVTYKIKFSLTDGTEAVARRTYDDIKALDGKIRQQYAELPHLPVPVTCKGDSTVTARSGELNLHLQGEERRLIYTSGRELGLDGEQASHTGQSQMKPSTVTKYLPFGFGLPGSKRRRSSVDPGFAINPAAQTNSVQSNMYLPTSQESRDCSVTGFTADKLASEHPVAVTGVLGDVVIANGRLTVKETRRFEPYDSVDRA